MQIRYKRLGKLLQEGRERKGIDPESAVMQLGLTNRQYLWRCESGESNFPAARLRKALELYRIPVATATEAMVLDFSECATAFLRAGA